MKPPPEKVPVTGPEVRQAAEPGEVVLLRAKAGLCAGCRYAEIRRSKRSAFLRCARADRDERYPRYPGLPVVACGGFESAAAWQPAARSPGG